MDAARKKELKDAYKSRQVVGGICSIRCSGNQNVRIQATADIEGSRNRFDFAVLTGTCPDPSMRGDWLRYGSKSFTFTVLEEIRKRDSQTDEEFSRDIETLHDIWLDKIAREEVQRGR
jgi:hypothetical protein